MNDNLSVSITVYKDTVTLQPEENNLMEVKLSEECVRRYVDEVCHANYDEWINSYTADNTEDLFNFVVMNDYKYELVWCDYIDKTTCINVYSDMNTWNAFCVFVSDKDLAETEKIVRKAYENWYELPDEEFEPLDDYVIRCITENNIKFDIYYKKERDDT